MRPVAALFVAERGPYIGLPGVDAWPESRDARLYAGPWPVVAHPPCARWSRLAGLMEARHGLVRGDDGGCFESALGSVRRWGGVLEHPANSAAWPRFGLPRPPTSGGWVRTPCGGWTCCVEQGRYGHPARKTTWLYVFGARPPELRWGVTPIPKIGNESGRRWADSNRRPGSFGALPKSRRHITPPEFRDLLISIARSASVAGS